MKKNWFVLGALIALSSASYARAPGGEGFYDGLGSASGGSLVRVSMEDRVLKTIAESEAALEACRNEFAAAKKKTSQIGTILNEVPCYSKAVGEYIVVRGWFAFLPR
jgi:hypothetical protein